MSLPQDLPVEQFQRRYAPIVKPTEDLEKYQDVFYNVRMSDMARRGGPLQRRVGRRPGPIWPQYSTQWDAFCHVGYEFDVDGDGATNSSTTTASGVAKTSSGPSPTPEATGVAACLPRSTWAWSHGAHGMQGRGVLVDLVRHFGREFHLSTRRSQEVMATTTSWSSPATCCSSTPATPRRSSSGAWSPIARSILHLHVPRLQDQALLDWIAESKSPP